MAEETTTFGELIAEGVLEVGDGYRAKNDELGGSGFIFLRAGHVRDTHIDFDGVEFFHRELSDRLANKLSRPGDTIVTTKGNSTGRTSFVTKDMPVFVYSPHLSYWRSRDPAALSPLFLRYWSRGPEFAAQLSGMAASTDMAPYLSLTDQHRLRITVPPPSHQALIGEVLGALDDKIDFNRRMNQTLEAMTQSLFKSWFVDFDPVRAKDEGRQPVGMDAATAALFPDDFEESELGRTPRAWRVAALDSTAVFLNGLALQKFPASENEPNFPVLKISHLRAGATDGNERARAHIPAEYIVDDGDLIFSWSGSLLVRIWTGGRAALNQHLFKVTSPAFPRWFVRGWLNVHLPEFQAIAAGKATTMGHIQRHHLSDAMVLVPPPELLASVGRLMEPLEDLMVANEVENRALTTLRDLLLPKFLSGELRLNRAEAAVAATV
jgi:type I restriction enzyme, S subunit